MADENDRQQHLKAILDHAGGGQGKGAMANARYQGQRSKAITPIAGSCCISRLNSAGLRRQFQGLLMLQEIKEPQAQPGGYPQE